MRWRDMRGSENLEDREGAAPPGRGLGPGFKLGGAGLIAVVAISLLLGLNPLDVLVSLQGGTPPSAPTRSTPPPASSGSAARDETKPRLVLFRGAVDSACGLASSAVGPFYCSPDSRVISTGPSSRPSRSGLGRRANSRALT